MIDPSVMAALNQVLRQSAGAPSMGLPEADLVMVRREHLRSVVAEVRVLDAEVRELIAGQDVDVDAVHLWYYDEIRTRLERQGMI